MEIQCPNCKKAQMTKGRIAFPCRICGTMLRDPRVIESTVPRYVDLNEVLRIAKQNGVSNRMKEILNLPVKEINDGDNTSI